MKTLCKFLKGNVMEIIYFEKKKMILLTDKEHESQVSQEYCPHLPKEIKVVHELIPFFGSP